MLSGKHTLIVDITPRILPLGNWGGTEPDPMITRGVFSVYVNYENLSLYGVMLAVMLLHVLT